MASRTVLIGTLLIILAACQPHVHDAHALGHTDWNRASVIHVELRDYGFAPREIRLSKDRPYRIDFFNSGGNTHYFNAPEFFRAISAYKVEVPGQAEVQAERYTRFEIMRRGGSLHFFFIPRVAGTYRFHCHLENHAELGVEGTIIVD